MYGKFENVVDMSTVVITKKFSTNKKLVQKQQTGQMIVFYLK